jgi:hypothetical protein
MRFLSMVKKLMYQNSVVPDGNDDAEGTGEDDALGATEGVGEAPAEGEAPGEVDGEALAPGAGVPLGHVGAEVTAAAGARTAAGYRLPLDCYDDVDGSHLRDPAAGAGASGRLTCCAA